MQSVHYKVTNTTKWVGEKRGKHKNGFFVAPVKGKPMGPGRHLIVEKVTPGMLGMQRKGWISIEEVPDIKVEVKEQIEHAEAANQARIARGKADVKAQATGKALKAKEEADHDRKVADALVTDSEPDTSYDKEALRAKSKATLSENTDTVSGEGGTDPLADVEAAINPDGQPNFVVNASKRKSGRGGIKN